MLFDLIDLLALFGVYAGIIAIHILDSITTSFTQNDLQEIFEEVVLNIRYQNKTSHFSCH